jgi:hypothetical protein
MRRAPALTPASRQRAGFESRTAGRRTTLDTALLVVLLAMIVWRLVIPAIRASDFDIVSDETAGGWSRDYAANLTFAKAFWRDEVGYDADSILRMTRERVGRPVEHALPFPYLPTMLWLLAPLCLLPAGWSYVVWTLLGIAAAWWVARSRPTPWLVAALFTPVAFWCLRDGQTALLTTAGLWFLVERDLDDRAGPTSDWPDALVLWALLARPPIGLTAALVLCLRGRARSVGAAAALTIATTAALLPRLGTGWLSTYVHLLTHYDLETANPIYLFSLVPELMGNFRALLHVTLGVGDAAAARASTVAWVASIVALAAASLRGALRARALWTLALLAYLLFCPHVTGTEDMHLMLVLALFVPRTSEVPPAVRSTLVAAVFTALSVTPMLGREDAIHIPVAVASKVLVAALVAVDWRRRDRAAGARMLQGCTSTT